jgi:hypothetical protein
VIAAKATRANDAPKYGIRRQRQVEKQEVHGNGQKEVNPEVAPEVGSDTETLAAAAGVAEVVDAV